MANTQNSWAGKLALRPFLLDRAREMVTVKAKADNNKTASWLGLGVCRVKEQSYAAGFSATHIHQVTSYNDPASKGLIKKLTLVTCGDG
ncbi:hypothetical protein MRB53_000311 [Persea americana]|uniref:Uncharacterized protein n=1 Tax=Persea americana TaxID=3435 RepID=A0ACC2MNT5_PERAE|nr:hypothetical protein MRB53_000311 [Persea americana]